VPVKENVENYLPLIVSGGYLVLDVVKNQATKGPSKVNAELKVRGDCLHVFENDKISIFEKL
jgi:hypothetical protein